MTTLASKRRSAPLVAKALQISRLPHARHAPGELGKRSPATGRDTLLRSENDPPRFGADAELVARLEVEFFHNRDWEGHLSLGGETGETSPAHGLDYFSHESSLASPAN